MTMTSTDSMAIRTTWSDQLDAMIRRAETDHAITHKGLSEGVPSTFRLSKLVESAVIIREAREALYELASHDDAGFIRYLISKATMLRQRSEGIVSDGFGADVQALKQAVWNDIANTFEAMTR